MRGAHRRRHVAGATAALLLLGIAGASAAPVDAARVDAARLPVVDPFPTLTADETGAADLLWPLTEGLLGPVLDTVDGLLGGVTDRQPTTPPVLHSRPGAERVIHLDFDGHRVEGTAWNGQRGAPAEAWDAAAYDTDGDPQRFSAEELAVVEQVWQRVAEDYAPFDVDVTTEDPGDVGGRVVISSTDTIQGQCDCGGTAYPGSYGDPARQPAWVFSDGVKGARNIAYAASHEMGHQLGLAHDGTSGSEYFEGQGRWGPLMGYAHPQPLTQWSKGEYPGADNTQDDLELIAEVLGWAADDHAGTADGATPLTDTATGVIGTPDDVDAFTVTVDQPTRLTAAVAPVGANLHLGLTVQDGPAAQPTLDGLGATVVLPTGTWTVVVDGVGSGTWDGGGYGDYGSLGRYSLTLTSTGTP